MNANVVTNSVGITSAAVAVGGIKLVLVGACLAVGFSIGNYAVGKVSNAYIGWKYARMEKKNPEPPEEDHDNGGLSSDAASQEAGSQDL